MRLPCALKTKMKWLNISVTTKDCFPKKILIRDLFLSFLADIIFRYKNNIDGNADIIFRNKKIDGWKYGLKMKIIWKNGKAKVKTIQPSIFAFYHLLAFH